MTIEEMKAAMKAILEKAKGENRSMNDAEEASLATIKADIETTTITSARFGMAAS